MQLIPPPAKWKPELKGCNRAWHWQRAAGVNKDGSCKTSGEHGKKRGKIIKNERLRVIHSKRKSEWTQEDRKFLDQEKLQKSRNDTSHKKWRTTNRLKIRMESNERNKKKRKKQMEEVTKFISKNNLEIDTNVLSNEDAFQYLVELMDDKTTPIGKDIFDAFGGMTLRKALWEGHFSGSVYALASRGHPVGGSGSEYIRFIASNYDKTIVLTHPDGKRFKYSDREFKDLQTTFVTLRVCSSYANCTKIESAFQLLFDFMEVGSRKLWQWSGNGHSDLALRKCDMKYIKDTGDKNPKFICGLTIIKNVSVVERTTDSNGKDVAAFITGGLGTKCKVNQPISVDRNCNESQRKALKTTQETLGPNYMAVTECRKRKAEFMEDSVMRW